jgi:methylated-DNA-protein-cysteine methyltransferase-like protein
MSRDDDCARILDVVRRIPRGCVATYGQVAAQAGFPKRPRLAGYALSHLPAGHTLPWHRVINAQGRPSFERDGAVYRRQLALLEQEGVEHRDGRIDLARYRWQPRSAAPLLD